MSKVKIEGLDGAIQTIEDVELFVRDNHFEFAGDMGRTYVPFGSVKAVWEDRPHKKAPDIPTIREYLEEWKAKSPA